MPIASMREVAVTSVLRYLFSSNLFFREMPTTAQKKKRRSVKSIQSEYLDMNGPGWMRLNGARMS